MSSLTDMGTSPATLFIVSLIGTNLGLSSSPCAARAEPAVPRLLARLLIQNSSSLVDYFAVAITRWSAVRRLRTALINRRAAGVGRQNRGGLRQKLGTDKCEGRASYSTFFHAVINGRLAYVSASRTISPTERRSVKISRFGAHKTPR